jgi:trafficking protein particle complex subunit 6
LSHLDSAWDKVLRRGESPTLSSSSFSLDRFSRDRPRFTDTMDVIKFLCKDLWTIMFRKQIDNLKTNHRVYLFRGPEADRQGVYVLTDNNFKWFSRMSTASGTQDAIHKAQPVVPLYYHSDNQFLWFPCGLIRGALSNLGVEATVIAEIAPVGLPSVSFQVKAESS